MLQIPKTPVDARNAVALLLLSNIIAFTQNSLRIELSLLLLLGVLLVSCGCGKQAVKWGLVFAAIFAVQHLLLPKITFGTAAGFAVMFAYVRKMLPCLMVGTILVKKVPAQYLILALRKFRVPQTVLIPLAVTVRYLPSLAEEFSHIRDAMKLRGIRGLRRVECTLVPIIMSAIETSDELSAAAVTRGVENPCRKTSLFELRFSAVDFLSFPLCLTLTVLSLLSKGGIL